jgi:hypothetical protein
MHFKIMMDPKNLNAKLQVDGHSGQSLGIKRLDNRLNANMNNIINHDFAMRDWIDDTDLMLPRISAEFPRISEAYTSFESGQEKPWGSKSKPIYYDPFLDENLMRLNEEKPYQQGVWHYTGYPLTDHHDFAGIPNIWRGIQTLLGLEYRP